MHYALAGLGWGSSPLPFLSKIISICSHFSLNIPDFFHVKFCCLVRHVLIEVAFNLFNSFFAFLSCFKQAVGLVCCCTAYSFFLILNFNKSSRLTKVSGNPGFTVFLNMIPQIQIFLTSKSISSSTRWIPLSQGEPQWLQSMDVFIPFGPLSNLLQVQEFFPNPRHSSLVCFVGKASEMILTNSLTQQSINLSGFLTKPTIKNWLLIVFVLLPSAVLFQTLPCAHI